MKRAAALFLAAAVLAGCGGGDEALHRDVDGLRGVVEGQRSEIASLRDQVRALDERARALDERVSSLSLQAPPAAAGRGGAAADAEEAAPGAAAPGEAPAEDAVAAFLDTEAGRRKVLEIQAAAEKARDESNRQAMRERMQAGIREMVTGRLTEQLGLDPRQQEAVIAVAQDAMEQIGEIWRGARDAGGDPAFITTAREKMNQVRQDSMDRIAQALTAEQFSKFQEIQGDGGMLLGGRGGFGPGAGGPGGGGRAGRGGSGGGAPR